MYNNFDSFRSHVYRKHREALHSSTEGSTSQVSGCESRDNLGGNADLLSGPVDFAPLERSLSRHDNLKSMAALFLLKVREEYKLPLGTVEKLVDFKGRHA